MRYAQLFIFLLYLVYSGYTDYNYIKEELYLSSNIVDDENEVDKESDKSNICNCCNNKITAYKLFNVYLSLKIDKQDIFCRQILFLKELSDKSPPYIFS